MGSQLPITPVILVAIERTALIPRATQYVSERESEDQARRRGLVDIALVRLMREALLRASDVGDIHWKDFEELRQGSAWLSSPREALLSQGTWSRIKEVREMSTTPCDEDFAFPFCRFTVTRRIKAAVAAAGYAGEYGADSPRSGLQQEMMDRLNIPPRLWSDTGLARSLAPHYVQTFAAVA